MRGNRTSATSVDLLPVVAKDSFHFVFRRHSRLRRTRSRSTRTNWPLIHVDRMRPSHIISSCTCILIRCKLHCRMFHRVVVYVLSMSSMSRGWLTFTATRCSAHRTYIYVRSLFCCDKPTALLCADAGSFEVKSCKDTCTARISRCGLH